MKQIKICEYCGYAEPEHEENCLKSPETKAQLLINQHLQFTNNVENAAMGSALITVNMIKAVLPSGDLMAFYSRVRQILLNTIK